MSLFDPVEAKTYVAAMQEYWTKELGNVATQPLAEFWTGLCYHLNKKILTYGRPSGREWTVLQGACGSGKSRGMMMYLAQLGKRYLLDHGAPGALVVVNRQKAAEETAREINRLVGRPDYAKHHHSDDPLESTAFKNSPVICICHSAYSLALDALNSVDPWAGKWSTFTRWWEGNRKLIIVDESLEITQSASVHLDEICRALGFVSSAMRAAFPKEVAAIQAVVSILADSSQQPGAAERLVHDGKSSLESLSGVDLSEFRKAMWKTADYCGQLGEHDKSRNRSIAERFDGVWKGVQAFVDRWMLYAKQGPQVHTLSTAKLLVPEQAQGCVVLDATAKLNRVYEVFPHARLIPAPKGLRDYSRVTLHVASGLSVGKHYLKEETRCRDLVGKMMEHLSQIVPRKEVFICCHKDVEPAFGYHTNPDGTITRDFDVPFTYYTDHWGNTTGSNAYQNCNVMLAYGLPFKPTHLSSLEYFAIRGPQTQDWLDNRRLRKFNNHADIKKAMQVGGIASSVVQTLSRIRCRRVTGTDGTCDPCDIYLMLPGPALAKPILKAIREQMPGVQVVRWDYAEAKKAAKPSRYDGQIIRLAETMPPGRVASSDICKQLNIPSTSWERLSQALRDATSPLAAAVATHGAHYEVTRQGKRTCAYLTKRAS